jgi:hypothetical protein
MLSQGKLYQLEILDQRKEILVFVGEKFPYINVYVPNGAILFFLSEEQTPEEFSAKFTWYNVIYKEHILKLNARNLRLKPANP